MASSEEVEHGRIDDNVKPNPDGHHDEDAELVWWSSSSRTSGDSSGERDELFDQFITIDDSPGNAALTAADDSAASSMGDDATFAQLLLEDMEKYNAVETIDLETDDILEQLKQEPHMLPAAVSPLTIKRQRPRQSLAQELEQAEAADPFTPGRHNRPAQVANSISYHELLKIEGLSMHSPGVPVPAPLSVPRRVPPSSQTPSGSPQKRAGKRLEGIYSSLRRATHSIRHAHQTSTQTHAQKQVPGQRQRSMNHPPSGAHLVGSVADVNLTSAPEDDDPFIDPMIQQMPRPNPLGVYSEARLAPAADIHGASTARFPSSLHSHVDLSTGNATFYLASPPLVDHDGLPYDDTLPIHMPQPLPGNPCSAILADGLTYQHIPVPPVPHAALPVHSHTRRHGPKAPSSGARYAGGPSQAPLTSPRKRSSGSGHGSGGTSPSPTPRTARKASTAMRRSRSGSFGAGHHSVGHGEVRKRRSCQGLGRSASTNINTMISATSTPRSASGSSFSSASEGGSFGMMGGGGAGGFVNFTMDDSEFLMTGVAPSGSSKTKARREKEVADRTKRLSEAFAAMGGDVARLKAEGIVM